MPSIVIPAVVKPLLGIALFFGRIQAETAYEALCTSPPTQPKELEPGVTVTYQCDYGFYLADWTGDSAFAATPRDCALACSRWLSGSQCVWDKDACYRYGDGVKAGPIPGGVAIYIKTTSGQVPDDRALGECRKEVDDARSEALRDRTEKDRVERECADNVAKEQDSLKDFKRQHYSDMETKRQERDWAVRAERERLERKAALDQDRAEMECANKLGAEKAARERSETRYALDLEEKEQLHKNCNESRTREETRVKDDICFDPGFGDWPAAISTFDAGGSTYVVQPKSHVSLADRQSYDSTSPANCARHYCSNQTDCFGIGWDSNLKDNKCIVYQDTPYRKVQKADIKAHASNYMIVKRERLA